MCGGSGKGSYNKRDVCELCNGNGTINESNHIQVFIKPGSYHGQKLKIENAGDYDVNTKIYQDLILVIHEKEHSLMRKER